MWTSLGAKSVAALTELLLSKFDVRELHIPVILALIDVDDQHLGHRVVRTLHTTVAVQVIRADGDFASPENLETACETFEKKRRAFSQYAARASPEGTA